MSRLHEFFEWATNATPGEQRSQYQGSSDTGSSNYGGRGRGYHGGRGGYRGGSDRGGGRTYGPSPSYNYHGERRGRSPSPHRQDSRRFYAGGAGSRQRSPQHGAYRNNRGRGNRYDVYNDERERRAANDRRRRAEEDDLRARALQGRIKPPHEATPWVRSIFPPDINKAVLDTNGHPVCPLEQGDSDDDSDYGSDSEVPSLPTSWRTTELVRRADALAHEANGREYKRHVIKESDAIGLWAGKSLDTVDEADNVLRWVARTEPSAYHFLHCERVRLGSDPTLERTAGQVFLLQRQNAASEQFWYATTGRRKAPSRYEVPAPFDPKSGQRAVDDSYAYLGMAILGEDDTFVFITELAEEESEVRSGSHTRPMEAVRLYDNTEHRLWPFGMRVNERQWPGTETRYATAHRDDVLAWYTINALAPRRNRVGTSIDRAKFMEVLIRVLSVAGTFNRIAQTGQYVDANRALEHYPFIAINIGYSQVVGWLVQHGISREGTAILQLESFARSRRNRIEDATSPEPLRISMYLVS
ncbi:hypothetical protein C8R47DRAFT_1213860 [Mycena vitilis]|nr:hypothetical protein C8R47DRAFT_1213860 [Mycena vitilis]